MHENSTKTKAEKVFELTLKDCDVEIADLKKIVESGATIHIKLSSSELRTLVAREVNEVNGLVSLLLGKLLTVYEVTNLRTRDYITQNVLESLHTIRTKATYTLDSNDGRQRLFAATDGAIISLVKTNGPDETYSASSHLRVKTTTLPRRYNKQH